MKPSRLTIYIGFVWLAVYHRDVIFSVHCVIPDAQRCSADLENLTEDQVECLRGLYTSIKDLCVYQSSLYAEGKSYCTETWLNTGSECALNPQCSCRTIHMDCDNRRLTTYPQKIDQRITWLHLNDTLLDHDVVRIPFVDYVQLSYLGLNHNPIRSLEPFTFRYLRQLTALTLKATGIGEIKADVFYGLNNLQVLDLSRNHLSIITAKMFQKLNNLNLLDLGQNSIEIIENSAFDDLVNLNVLDLNDNNLKLLSSSAIPTSHALKILYAERNEIKTINCDTNGPYGIQQLNLRNNNISQLKSNMFKSMNQLEILDLSINKIETIEPYTFKDLVNLDKLDLHYNEINRLQDETFIGLSKLSVLNLEMNNILKASRKTFRATPKLQYLHTDEFRFCCLAKRVPHCLPLPDEFCSCHDLMTNIVLRICIWALGIIAVISNIFVIIFRTVNKNVNQIHSFLIKNLALSDLFMGIYLLTIASVDLYYRGAYGFHDREWRTSKLCNFAGFLSTFSSELTVFTLTVITLDRYLSIANPFCVHRREIKRARLLMLAVWILALIIAIIPLPIFQIHYFSHFYGRSGVCLPLHITGEKFHGWEYSVLVFIVLNTISFAIIITCYISIYWIANKTRLNVQIRDENRTQQKKMAFRMTLLVSVDAACWIPIILLGLRSLAGFGRTSSDVYAWIAVFVLPLNAALNPILYTVSLIPLRRINWNLGNVNQYLKFWNRSTINVSNDT